MSSTGSPFEHVWPSQPEAPTCFPIPRNPPSIAATATVHAGGGVKVVVNGPSTAVATLKIVAVGDMMAVVVMMML